jgi:membrane-associated phospholipid phosphatase
MRLKFNIYLIVFLLGIPVTVCSQNTDIDILKPINKNESGFKNTWSKLNTGATTTLSISIPAGLAITGFIMRDKKMKQDAMYMGAAFLVSTLVTKSVKHMVNRQRPFAKYPFIVKRADSEAGLSFPSGHTSAAFSTATSLSLRYRKWYIIAPACIFASSVGWARMYQGVHYPSDVLAGALTGAASAWLGYKAQKWMAAKKEQKKKLTL